jgi:predicted ATPase
MEKLTRLSLKGFRSVRSLEIQIEPLTVVIGANGSGKSNLIGVLNLLSYMLSDNVQLYVGRNGGGSSILHYGQQHSPTLSADFTFEDERGRSEYGFTLGFAAPDRLIFEEERLRFQRVGDSKPFTKHYSMGQTESVLPRLANETDGGVLNTVARVFVNRLRGLQTYHFHDTSGHAPVRVMQDIERNRALLTNGGNLAAFLYMLRSAHPRHYERIVSTVRLAVPYLQEFILEPSALSPERIQLRWRDRNPDYEFGPHQLSDGSMRAIALITALMQPEELLPTVIAIDEPELGLHPGAVSLIGSLIKAVSAKRQVIVATQSPRLVSEFAPEDVVIAEREESDDGYGHSTFRRLNAPDLGDWLKEYDLGTLFEMNVTGGGPR